jgi:tellurite resistance protein
MHEQEFAIVKALVPVAWADGKFAEQELECIKAFLDAYNASDEERKTILEYAKEKRTLADIHLQDLSADDRRILLQHAVLVSFADGEQAIEEDAFLKDLSKALKIPDDEAKAVMSEAAVRAKKNLNLLG